jgi:hypothetical protein
MRADNNDDGEVISLKVWAGPAKNETHSVKVMYYIQKRFPESYLLW